jgi:hypothetical protein
VRQRLDELTDSLAELHATLRRSKATLAFWKSKVAAATFVKPHPPQ